MSQGPKKFGGALEEGFNPTPEAPLPPPGVVRGALHISEGRGPREAAPKAGPESVLVLVLVLAQPVTG
jgi:hypothetical protein